uniref:BED-type domain-containing protein n=1 Tax=Aegilops tauschii subsp. strangulata TaxID=200361 RepID=A0A453CZG0_AEGTS
MCLVFLSARLLPFPHAELPFLPSLTRSRDLPLPDLMMEPAGDSSLEAAIAWLVQTILATLLMDKMEAWIRQVGLADDVERLQREVERVEMGVASVKGRAAGNSPLSRALAHVKELLYDADDVVDDLDYYRLQQQVQGVTSEEPDGMRGAERVDEISRGHVDTLNVSVGKLRSAVWEHFTITETVDRKRSKAKCKYCRKDFNCETKTNGTSSMKKHLEKEHSVTCTKTPGAHPPNPSSTDNAIENATLVEVGSSSNRKRKRTNKEPAQTTADNTRWDKAELSNRIIKITSQLQLQGILWAFSKVLDPHGSSSASSSNHHQPSTTSNQHAKTSSLAPREVYGRVAEMNTIRNLIAENKCDALTVLPIVGIAGVGKTTLAQSVYNDPRVKGHFHHKIWVCVSRKFDEVMLTREMLDFERHEGSPHKNGRHEGISSLAKLQEILKDIIEYQSKSFLLILDDVWDSMDDHQWRKLVCPFVSSQAKGNLILVTTRNLSVAHMLGTREPIKLGALENDVMWLLLKSCAFRDVNYEGNQSLSIVGRQISEKLKGNPLAAETAGALLRKKFSIDYWRIILKNEDWKSMELGNGIMAALKLSYDQLPYHLQQCFSYCSIFPDSYQFLGEELVSFWMSQGFVKCNNSSQRLEQIGQCYLIDLVNLGFFEEVKREEPYLGCQVMYGICGLMHDFVIMVSRTDCASIDGLQRNKMPRTLRHLSIVTGSAYKKNQHGNIPRNNKFEENLRNTITSVSELRTLVLLGHYDFSFLLLFQDIFQKAHNLRVLQMSAAPADFLKHGFEEVDGSFPQILSKLYHLQVLDVGSYTDRTMPGCIDNLVSLRHLVVHKGVYCSIATIDNMLSFQEQHGFKFHISSGFEITRLQSTEHWMHVDTLEDVYEAGLVSNEQSEKLHIAMEGEDWEPHWDLTVLKISLLL